MVETTAEFVPPVRCSRRRRSWSAVIAALLVMLVAVAPSAPADAGAPAPRQGDDDAARQLAERYRPIVVVKDQDEPCDPDGEPFAPAPIDIVLDNPQIALRQVGRGDPVVLRGPSAADLFGLGEGFFVDFPGSSLTPGCIYERDFERYAEGYEPTVYAHVVQSPDVPDLVFLQYWLYWYYNDWNNKHESDWEGVTVVFEASSVDEALRTEPLAVGYSQHEGGERADWDDDKLERDGDRPVVYSSARSHASYFGEAFYLGRGASEGFGCDDTSGPSTRLDPAVVVLPDSVDDPSDPLAWLEYGGRWGERQGGAFNGPTGPAAKDRWLDPAPWFEELRDSSVVIPAGDSAASSIIGVFCDLVERGSGLLISATTSPQRLVVAVLVVGLLVRWLVGRTRWDTVPAEPVIHRRRAGQIVRATVGIYRREPLVFIVVGLIYIPAAIVTGLLSALVQLIPFVGSLLSLSGNGGGTSLVLALLVGTAANIAAFVIVNSIVTHHLVGGGRGLEDVAGSAQAAWHRRRDLAGAFARSYVTVFVLLTTILLAPFGIRQLVRYQFASQAVMADDESGGGALRRSSDLVRGRWWHTAVVAAAFNGASALVALLVALLLLVIGSGLPLWAFSALASLVYALVVPAAAIGMTLLYGDAVAEQQEVGEGDVVDSSILN